MDKDRIEGKGKDLLGHGKEGVGKLTNDREMQSEGQADQAEGTVQETWGQAKDKVRDVADSVRGSNSNS